MHTETYKSRCPHA